MLGCKCCSSGIAAVWESPLSLGALSSSPVGASRPEGISQQPPWGLSASWVVLS